MPENFAMKHTSFSSLSSWTFCGKQYELEKVKKVPQVPAWFLIGGSAFHKATEHIDEGFVDQDTPTSELTVDVLWDYVFGQLIDAAAEGTAVPREKWRAAGITRDRPKGQDYDHWNKLGPELLVQYQKWNHGGHTLADYGDGPAIEVALDEHFDFSVLPFRGYVDRVFDGLIVDYKTGTSKPKSPMQLGFYRAGLLMKYGDAPDKGAYYMAREGRLTKPEDLSMWTPEYAGKLLDQHRRAVEAEVFLPNVSFSCNMCPVRDACYTVGGYLSSKYDSLNPDYEDDHVEG